MVRNYHTGLPLLPPVSTVLKRALGIDFNQAIEMTNDKRFLTGKGRYVDDMVLPNMTWAHIVRSDVAHAIIKDVGIEAAAQAPDSSK